MEKHSTMNHKENQTNEITLDNIVTDKEAQEIIKNLPVAKNFMGSKMDLVNYQGFWIATLKPILCFQKHFQAKNTDLIVCSFPKTGTTWLKALLFSIVNRDKQPHNQSPLLTHNPHQLVYYLDSIYRSSNQGFPRPGRELDELPSPRLLHTHLPYQSLPETMKSSACKILYIGRNPLDTLVSYWHFYSKMMKNLVGDQGFEPSTIEEFFEEFCRGNIGYGPYFEHLLGYWKQSLEQPSKVLFLKYEDLKNDPSFYLKKLADFVGLPFFPQEESDGVIEGVVELCSIKTLKELDVNKNGQINEIDCHTLFRKGEVGDWMNHHFTPLMVDKMKKLMQEKFEGSGLSFSI